ncbi:DUF4252 domain-containing protein [Rurimicrobium arvi]|uniref:DUF4252 domain-containing protein n=1 Tax=Rurimicrobium arvi TaxID=2049916 RepID=A0ABP8MUS9_9BACT
MNKLIALIAAIFLFASCQAAPQGALGRFYSKYRSDTAVEQIHVPKLLLRIFANDPDIRKVLRYMKSVRLFTAGGTDSRRTAIGQDFARAMEQDGYEDALKISQDGEQIHIRIREDGEMIRSVVISISNKEELVLLHAGTQITYEQLSRMLDYIQTDKGKSGLKQVAGGKS